MFILLQIFLQRNKIKKFYKAIKYFLCRVLIELVSKMQEMTMDKTELGCLRAIVLFNPDVKGLQDINRVEQLRERVYATLEEYTR